MFSGMIKFSKKSNKTFIAVILSMLILNFSISYSYSQSSTKTELRKEKTPGLKEYSLEFLGATIGELTIGAVGLGLTAIPMSLLGNIHDGQGIVVAWGLSGYSLGGVIGAPFGAVITGKLMRQRGSMLGAFGGGVLGTYFGSCLIINSTEFTGISKKYVLPTPKLRVDEWQLISIALILPSLGAVTGYNLFRPKNVARSSFFMQNLQNIAFTFQPDKCGTKPSPKFGMNIIWGF